MQPPPGGEEDKSGPYLIGSDPPDGATGVEPSDQITLFFSEPIQKPAQDRAVFVSPRPSTPAKVKWKSDRVVIVLPTMFADNQTYVVSAATEIKDLRGNRVDSTTSIAFTTGAAIDSGLVSGHVMSEKGKPDGGAIVALYDVQRLGDSVAIDTLYGDYVAQTNQDGYFSLPYLPNKEFRLVAFRDKNRDERCDPYREAAAVPDRPIAPGRVECLDSLTLTLATRDTTVPMILSASRTPDGLIRTRLSKAIPVAPLSENPARMDLRPLHDTTSVVAALSLLESDEETSTSPSFYCGPLAAGEYMVRLTYDTTQPAISYSSVVVGKQEDEVSPLLVAFYPDGPPSLPDDLTIMACFSEPLDTSQMTPQTLVLWEGPETRAPVFWEWLDPLRLHIRPDTVRPGTKYRLEVTEFELADLAGNRLGDSLREYSFVTLDEDSLGWISGTVTTVIPGKETDPVHLVWLDTGSKRRVEVSAMSGEEFKVTVPAGKYLAEGFIDSDGDGQRGSGSVQPYCPAETQAVFTDTITVRARFETAGIELRFR